MARLLNFEWCNDVDPSQPQNRHPGESRGPEMQTGRRARGQGNVDSHLNRTATACLYVPACAGTADRYERRQVNGPGRKPLAFWIPAFAGMTEARAYPWIPAFAGTTDNDVTNTLMSHRTDRTPVPDIQHELQDSQAGHLVDEYVFCLHILAQSFVDHLCSTTVYSARTVDKRE